MSKSKKSYEAIDKLIESLRKDLIHANARLTEERADKLQLQKAHSAYVNRIEQLTAALEGYRQKESSAYQEAKAFAEKDAKYEVESLTKNCESFTQENIRLKQALKTAFDFIGMAMSFLKEEKRGLPFQL